jgi:hypothetical protein
MGGCGGKMQGNSPTKMIASNFTPPKSSLPAGWATGNTSAKMSQNVFGNPKVKITFGNKK